MIRGRMNRLLLAGAGAAANLVRPVMNRVARAQAKDIGLQRQRRALASSVEYLERHMRGARAADTKFELLDWGMERADVTGGRLICEFGVFTGGTINHLATRTSKTIFGFDSFEGLPERWDELNIAKGHFAVERLPPVRSNVTLIKGWFHESLPPFLAEHTGMVGFLHIDCDLYSSTSVVFDLLKSRLGPGTVIVFDEFFNFPGWEHGEAKAFDEFIARTSLACEFIGYTSKHEQVAVMLIDKKTIA